MNKPVPKEFWAVTLIFVAMLAALAIAVVFGGLSPRVFALLAVVLMVFPFLRYRKLFQAAAKEPQPFEATKATDVLLSQARSAKVRIGTLTALGCFAIWETRGGPLAPRLIGLGMLLLLLAGNILTLLQSRKQLKQLNTEQQISRNGTALSR